MIYWKLKATYKREGSEFMHEVEALSDNPNIEHACEEFELRVKDNYPDAREVTARADVDAD